MDLLRGLAVLLVVLLHAEVLIPGRTGVELPGWTQVANDTLAPVRIPLLIILSGMLLGASLGKGSARFFGGKLRHIAWPFLVWTGVYTAVVMRPGSVGDFLLGATYLWYLLFLLIYYAAARLLSPLPTTGVAAVAFVFAVLAPEDSKYLERMAYLFALFLLGHLLAGSPRLLRWAACSPWALGVAGLLLLAHVLLGDPGAGYGPGTLLATLAGLLAGMRLGRLVAGSRVVSPLRFVGRASLVYYVVHFPVLVVLASVVALAGLRDPFVVLVGWVAALAVCTVLALLRDRPQVSWLFLFPETWLRGGRRPGGTAPPAVRGGGAPAGSRPSPSRPPEGRRSG